jgi:DNA-binding transcriptional MerR regulator
MRWRVGDLAKMTGLTVRTLHHYEEIGLLAAAARTDSGHRLYDEASVQRLYQICALRNLGIPLTGIRRFIGDSASVASVLHQHLAHVEQQVEELVRLRDRLRRICRRPDSHADAAELLRTIEAMSRLERHVATRRRHATARPAGSTEQQWRVLAGELRACMDAGNAPSTGRARDVAIRARELIHQFAGNDPALLDALRHLRTADPPADLAGWDPALMTYLDRALRALDAEEDTHAERATRKERRTVASRHRP